MRTLTAPQARSTRLACFGTQLRRALWKALLAAPDDLRASGDAFHARSWFLRLPVRQETLFTHGVGSRAIPCVRRRFSRTEFAHPRLPGRMTNWHIA